MIYAYLDKNIKATNIIELTRNVSCEYIPIDKLRIPGDAECNIVHGVLRGMDEVVKRSTKSNIPWVMMDNGYLGKYKELLLTLQLQLHTDQVEDLNMARNYCHGEAGKEAQSLFYPPLRLIWIRLI